MLAHIAGVPVQESLLYLAPVIVLVAWMYFAGWRERRRRGGATEAVSEEEGPDRLDAADGPRAHQRDLMGAKAPRND